MDAKGDFLHDEVEVDEVQVETEGEGLEAFADDGDVEGL
jgi:hypothetical protein